MILFVSYSGALGGAERLLVDYAASLPRERCLTCPDGPLAQAARDAGVRVLVRPVRRLQLRGRRREPVLAAARVLAHAREVRELVADLDPDLVVAWGMRSAIAAMVASTRYLFAHNDLLPGPAVGAVVRRAAARAQAVVVLSQTIADDLGAADPVVVLPGVDVNAWDAGTVAPADPPEVVVLGALVGWKAPELAIEVLALARHRAPALELRLRFVGEPLEGDTTVLDDLRRRVGGAGLQDSVEFAGFQADPRAALARATCLLHCAPREPFGLAVLEALAAGRPAIVPAAGGPAEIIDAGCGVLYPPGDAAAAAHALVEVAGDRALGSALGRAGRKRARGEFGLERARARFGDVVQHAARPAAARAAAGRAAAGRAAAGGAAARGAEARFAIVTVSHNSATQLEALLASVGRHLPGVRTVVVDSASSDASVAVARTHPLVTAIALPENVGFGVATNRGVQAVSEAVVVLLNPDVELLDGSLASLVHAVADGPERLLAPRVLAGDGRREDSVHAVPGSSADLLAGLIPAAMLPGSTAAPWRARGPRRVGWAVGCALGARTATLRRLGPFDPEIFLYGEDLDLGLRAAAAGIETWFWPAARVVHHRAHATRIAFGGESFDRLAQARREVVRRRLGPGRARLDDAAQALTFAARIAGKPPLRRSAARERAQLAALWRARRVDGRPS